jgi:signal transduction histidine kinase
VADDGVGLDGEPDRQPTQEHFGLMEMRERAETSGGWWTIQNNHGSGTSVNFWLPCSVPD